MSGLLSIPTLIVVGLAVVTGEGLNELPRWARIPIKVYRFFKPKKQRTPEADKFGEQFDNLAPEKRQEIAAILEGAQSDG